MFRALSLRLCRALLLPAISLPLVVPFAAAQIVPIEEGSGRLIPAEASAAASPVAPTANPPAQQADQPLAQTPVAPRTAPAVEEPAPPAIRASDLPVTRTAVAPPSIQDSLAVAPEVVGSPIVAMIDFRTSTLGRAEVEALTQALWAQLNVSGGVRLLPRPETRRWLIANDLYPYQPYGPAIPMALVVRRVNANFLVTGTIDRVQGSYVIELLVYTAASEPPILKDAGGRLASLDEMVQAMGPLAGEVLGAIEKNIGRKLSEGNRANHWLQTDRGAAGVKRSGTSLSVKPAAVKHASEETKTKISSAPPVRSEDSETAVQPKAETPKTVTPKSEMNDETPIEKAEAPPAHSETPAAESEAAITLQPAKSQAVAAPEATPKPIATPTPTPAAVKATPPAAPKAEGNAEELFQAALKLPATDNARLAKLKQAVALAPGNAIYTQQLGFDYFARQNYKECVKLCDQALALDPHNSQLLMIKGSAHISLAQWDEAVKACEASVQADAKNNFARYNLALALQQMKSPRAVDAWKDYLENAASDPQQQPLLADARAKLDALQGAAH